VLLKSGNLKTVSTLFHEKLLTDVDIRSLSVEFSFTLSMIREIEKICPEEGQLDIMEIEQDPTNTSNSVNPMPE
jgi:hypothetical protein